MSRDDGFANADLDTGFYHDGKVRRLARAHPDLFPIAAAGYLGILAMCWGRGERYQAVDAWPELLPWSPEAVAALQEAELLDEEQRVPLHAWTAWFGKAKADRDAARDRWRRAKRGNADSPSPIRAESVVESARTPRNPPRGNAPPSLPSLPTVSARAPARERAVANATNGETTGCLRCHGPATDANPFTALPDGRVKHRFSPCPGVVPVEPVVPEPDDCTPEP